MEGGKKKAGVKIFLIEFMGIMINFCDRLEYNLEKFTCVCQLEFFFGGTSRYNKKNSMDAFEFWTWF